MELAFIDKIGLELEGAWFKKQPNLLYDDKSVTGYISRFKKFYSKAANGTIDGYEYGGSNYLYYVGELISKPLDYPESVNFLTKNWPDDTMDRCGFHIHFSFKDLSFYSKLMEVEFFNYFLKFMDKWGKDNGIENAQFWHRLSGENTFCTKTFIPERQVKIREKITNDPNRYCILNYCFGMHKTIECRLLPTFSDKKTALASFDAVVNCFESYLKLNPPKSAELLTTDVAIDENELEKNEEIFTFSEGPNEEVVDVSVAKPKVKDIIKAKKAKSLGLKPYNLFAMRNRLEGERGGYGKKSIKSKLGDQPSFFEILEGKMKKTNNDEDDNKFTYFGLPEPA